MKTSLVNNQSFLENHLKSIKNPITRKQYWLRISGAMHEMSYNSLYYYRLLREKRHLVSKFTKQIEKDLNRTFPDDPFFRDPHSFEILENILFAYSFRNPTVGYCQGMNFIAGRFLTLGFSEVETFWMLVQVIENYMPFEYFSTMSGVLIDQKVFDFLLRTRLPKVAKALDRNEMNSSLITVQWFTCMFAYTFQKEVVARIWDEIFSHGHMVIYKISLAVFFIAQKEIVKKKEMIEIFQCIDQTCKKISDGEKFLSTANRKLFRVHPLLLERLKDAAADEVKKEMSERYDRILSEEEILNKIQCCCENEDVCKQKNNFTNGFFTFLADEEILVDEEYLDGEMFMKNVNVSLMRESETIMVGIKNHVCGIDEVEENDDRIHQTNVRSSFMVLAEQVRDFEFD